MNGSAIWHRATCLLLTWVLAVGGCQPRPPAGSGTGPGAAGGAEDAFAAYLAASVAQDREGVRWMVLLPDDPERRQWVLDLLANGEGPPPGTTISSQDVTMDGPVAVGRAQYRLPDGSAEPSPPGFLVRRDGLWKVVVDYFEGGGLTADEMAVVGRHLGGM